MSNAALLTPSHQDIFLPKAQVTINSTADWLALRSSLVSMIEHTKPTQPLNLAHEDLRQPPLQYKWIKNWIEHHEQQNDPVHFLGFAGTDSNCEYQIHNADKNSKLGAVDSIIYKHAGKIHMKRLNHTPSLRQNSLFNTDMNFYNQDFRELHQTLGSKLVSHATPLPHEQQNEGVEVHDHPLLNKVMHYKQVLLVERTGGRSAVNMTSAVDGANFELRIPGSDEIAKLSKESVKNLGHGAVEGLALPLAQLGIIGLFYPLVALGASVMKHELHEAKEELLHLHEKFEVKRDNLKEIAKELESKNPDTSAKLEQFLIQYENPKKVKVKKIRTDVHQLAEGIFRNLSKQNDPASQKTLVKALYNLNHLVEIQLERKQVKLEKQALKLFIAYGATSVAKYLAPKVAYKGLSIAGDVLNGAALGVMGISQVGVMLSGLFKSATGLLKFKTMQSNRQKIEALANTVAHEAAQIALTRYAILQKKQAFIEMLSKTVPGTTLSIGQAAMATWSLASFGFLVSGVGAPAGAGMMLGLLIPGVVLTLAASAPKIGLGSVLKHYKHRHYAEDTSLSKSQLMHLKLQDYVEKKPNISTEELLTQMSHDFTVSDKRAQYIELLQKSKSISGRKRFNELENSMGISNSKSLIDVVATLDENNGTSQFVSNLYNNYKKQLDVFKKDIIHAKVEANKITKRNFYKPKVLWHSELRHRSGSYTRTHKIVQLDYQRLAKLDSIEDKHLVYNQAFKVLGQSALQKSRSMRDALGQGLVALSEIHEIQTENTK